MIKKFFYMNKAALLYTINAIAGYIDVPVSDTEPTPICKWEYGIDAEALPKFEEYASPKPPVICSTYNSVIQYILRGGNPTAVGYWQQMYRIVGLSHSFIHEQVTELDVETATLEDAVQWYKDFMSKNLYGEDTAWLGYACFNKILYKAGIGLCAFNDEASAKAIGAAAYNRSDKFVDMLVEHIIPIPAKYTKTEETTEEE